MARPARRETPTTTSARCRGATVVETVVSAVVVSVISLGTAQTLLMSTRVAHDGQARHEAQRIAAHTLQKIVGELAFADPDTIVFSASEPDRITFQTVEAYNTQPWAAAYVSTPAGLSVDTGVSIGRGGLLGGLTPLVASLPIFTSDPLDNRVMSHPTTFARIDLPGEIGAIQRTQTEGEDSGGLFYPVGQELPGGGCVTVIVPAGALDAYLANGGILGGCPDEEGVYSPPPPNEAVLLGAYVAAEDPEVPGRPGMHFDVYQTPQGTAVDVVVTIAVPGPDGEAVHRLATTVNLVNR